VVSATPPNYSRSSEVWLFMGSPGQLEPITAAQPTVTSHCGAEERVRRCVAGVGRANGLLKESSVSCILTAKPANE